MSLKTLNNISEISLEAVFELASDGVVVLEDGLIAAANQRFADLCGYAPEALYGMPIRELMTGLSINDSPGPSAGNTTGANRRHNISLTVRKGAGKSLPVSVNIGRKVVDGKRIDFVFVSDCANRLNSAADLEKVRQLESIAALSGGIAHDYNNLLTAIIGNISLIQSYVDEDDIIFRLLNEAHEASLVAKALTQKLITFSRGGTPVKETCDLAAVAKNATEFTLSGSNIKCQFHLPDDLDPVDIDKTQIGQAIYNLVMNAREAMPVGGTLTVSAENAHIKEHRADLAPGRYVRLAIGDQGAGIPAEHLPKIFDPYFSTKKRGTQKGMGLGLSICHSIISQHKGLLRVESKGGRGTVVTVHLPVSDRTSRIEPSEQPALPIEPVHGTGRVLVMDDEEMIIRLVHLILTRLGYEAAFARHGAEALEMYAEGLKSKHPFDAVILDLTVRGGMGGEETMQKLLELDANAVGIVSSGYSDSPVIAEYEKYGFKGVIVKPYSLFEMSDKLARVISGQ